MGTVRKSKIEQIETIKQIFQDNPNELMSAREIDQMTNKSYMITKEILLLLEDLGFIERKLGRRGINYIKKEG
jgi:hypothetical protein